MKQSHTEPLPLIINTVFNFQRWWPLPRIFMQHALSCYMLCGVMLLHVIIIYNNIMISSCLTEVYSVSFRMVKNWTLATQELYYTHQQPTVLYCCSCSTWKQGKVLWYHCGQMLRDHYNLHHIYFMIFTYFTLQYFDTYSGHSLP